MVEVQQRSEGPRLSHPQLTALADLVRERPGAIREINDRFAALERSAIPTEELVEAKYLLCHWREGAARRCVRDNAFDDLDALGVRLPEDEFAALLESTPDEAPRSTRATASTAPSGCGGSGR